MELLALLAIGFKGLAAVGGIFLVAGGYLGYKYGGAVEKKAASDLSKAKQAVSGVVSKV